MCFLLEVQGEYRSAVLSFELAALESWQRVVFLGSMNGHKVGVVSTNHVFEHNA